MPRMLWLSIILVSLIAQPSHAVGGKDPIVHFSDRIGETIMKYRQKTVDEFPALTKIGEVINEFHSKTFSLPVLKTIKETVCGLRQDIWDFLIDLRDDICEYRQRILDFIRESICTHQARFFDWLLGKTHPKPAQKEIAMIRMIFDIGLVLILLLAALWSFLKNRKKTKSILGLNSEGNWEYFPSVKREDKRRY